MSKSNHAARSRGAVKGRRAVAKQLRPQISALGRRMQGRRLTYRTGVGLRFRMFLRTQVNHRVRRRFGSAHRYVRQGTDNRM
jgi:hypothetical protein